MKLSRVAPFAVISALLMGCQPQSASLPNDPAPAPESPVAASASTAVEAPTLKPVSNFQASRWLGYASGQVVDSYILLIIEMNVPGTVISQVFINGHDVATAGGDLGDARRVETGAALTDTNISSFSSEMKPTELKSVRARLGQPYFYIEDFSYSFKNRKTDLLVRMRAPDGRTSEVPLVIDYTTP